MYWLKGNKRQKGISWTEKHGCNWCNCRCGDKSPKPSCACTKMACPQDFKYKPIPVRSPPDCRDIKGNTRLYGTRWNEWRDCNKCWCRCGSWAPRPSCWCQAKKCFPTCKDIRGKIREYKTTWLEKRKCGTCKCHCGKDAPKPSCGCMSRKCWVKQYVRYFNSILARYKGLNKETKTNSKKESKKM